MTSVLGNKKIKTNIHLDKNKYLILRLRVEGGVEGEGPSTMCRRQVAKLEILVSISARVFKFK